MTGALSLGCQGEQPVRWCLVQELYEWWTADTDKPVNYTQQELIIVEGYY